MRLTDALPRPPSDLRLHILLTRVATVPFLSLCQKRQSSTSCRTVIVAKVLKRSKEFQILAGIGYLSRQESALLEHADLLEVDIVCLVRYFFLCGCSGLYIVVQSVTKVRH